jgi:hypothetical protein
MILKEGGNVFKDGDGQPLTQRINQTDIMTTVQWIERLTGIDFTQERDAYGTPVRWLGSTGRKASSGDLDLAVDANAVNKDELVARIQAWATAQRLDPKDWVRKSGTSVHIKTPINGDPNQGYVQTDLMFLKNLPWSTWALSASGGSRYRGQDRNVLINSIAKSLGYKLNQNAGIMDRATNELISDDPDKVAKMLLTPAATRADLATVESIVQALERDPKRDAKLADARDHFQREGVPFVESVEIDTEVNYLARLRDRIVNQGMYALIEDRQIREADAVGGRAKGIEHIEDLVFRKGTRGVDEAKKILKSAAADTPGTTTVKWDGKPAVVFGRRPGTGEFVLTDTSGFQATGYDGMFTSPRQIVADMQRRDDNARAKGNQANRVETLAPIYQTLWPALEAAFPKNVLGYVQGDLLYYPQRPWVEEAGNAVFQPNEVLYKIPLASDLGRKIAGTNIGIAMHTQYADQGSAKQPLGDIGFKKVPGLLLEPPIRAQQFRVDPKVMKQINELERSHGAAINQLFNPVELRSQKITDLASLCVDFINTRVGKGFAGLAQGFLQWLPGKVTPSKYQNILTYLQSPATNAQALEAAFDIWLLLHDLKMDVLHQLDLQHPGQEGWVMATPAGYAKAVSRMPGGFAAANRARNN